MTEGLTNREPGSQATNGERWELFNRLGDSSILEAMEPTSLRSPAVGRLVVGLVLLGVVCGVTAVVAGTPPRERVARTPDDAAAENPEGPGIELFKTKVRTILVHQCLECHGGKASKSQFDLATRASLLRGGANGASVVPGNHRESLLYKAITHQSKPHMPHKRRRLPAESIDAIAQWIDLGAPYDAPLGGTGADEGELLVTEDHRRWWSFQPLADVSPPPPSKRRKVYSGRTPIDRFIEARLEEQGLRPNAAASPRVLIRRLYFDLIGLPPEVDVVEAFAADPSEAAYAAIVDDLLKSPHHGERWARHWLDVARFAESHGFEHDYDRKHAYHYRDFVIEALERDLPFDQFVRWQLAGDELAPDEPLAWKATGFLGAGVFPTQITKKEVERVRYDALDDMLSTTGTAFLGLTIGCARCHDHKFDPIPARDYYRMLSTFTTTVRSEIDIPLDPKAHAVQMARFEKEQAQLRAARETFERDVLPARLDAWLAGADIDAELEREPWTTLEPLSLASKGGATMTRQEDGSILVGGKNPNHDTFTIVTETTGAVRALRIEALTHASLPKNGPGRAANGNFGLGEFRLRAEVDGGAPRDVELVDPRATHQQNGGNLSIAASFDGKENTGWAVDGQIGKNQAAVVRLAAPIVAPSGAAGSTKVRWTFIFVFGVNTQHALGRFRLAASSLATPEFDGGGLPDPVRKVLSRRATSGAEIVAEFAAEERKVLIEWYRQMDSEWAALRAREDRHQKKEKPQPPTVKVQVTSEGHKPMRHHSQGADFFDKTYYLHRGDTEQKGEAVSQSFLQVLTRHPAGAAHWIEPAPTGSKKSYRRRSLAAWMTDVEHGAGHLLARVAVNRLWQHHFGRGLVASSNDFGGQGDRPSHPKLLDWLAGELIREKWSLRATHRAMVLSDAYRRSAAYPADQAAIDPDNRYLWRRQPHRLEAEAIRDSLLSISGLLDESRFGPGTLDASMRRRSIYFFVKRSKLVPEMVLFDAPEPLVSQGERPVTTIAPQALLFMNNPNVRRYAEGFAARLRAAAASPEEAIDLAYRIALSRPPRADEQRYALAFLDQQHASYASAVVVDGSSSPSTGGSAPAPVESKGAKPRVTESRIIDSRALTDFCQTILSLNETVFIE